ncbi:MAG: A24 family peptidase, partial [Planctomycetota bacterium]|nr:A24 family peptidase [Planctomycetota bacterium]
YVPVVGWLVRGNPLSRGWRSDVRHAAVELVNGLLLAAILWAEFPNGFLPAPPVDAFAVEGMWLPSPASTSVTLQLVRLGLHLILAQSLLVATVIDFRQMIIPDGATVPAMLLALVVSAAAGGVWLVPLWYEDAGLLAILGMSDHFGGGVEVPAWLTAHPHAHGLLVSLAGLIVGGGTVWAVRWIGHWALGREAMGFGDVVLMAMIGAFVGWQPVLTVFFLAPVCAIVVVFLAVLSGTSREFPFGPWLSLAAILLLVAWQVIWPFAGRFFLMGRLMPFVGITILLLLAILLRGMRLIRGDRYWHVDRSEHWTSADQLLYLSQENAADSQTRWRSRDGHEWSGLASGRGSLGEQRWRASAPPSDWWRVPRKP